MGVDTHFSLRVLLEEKDFPAGSFRLLDHQVTIHFGYMGNFMNPIFLWTDLRPVRDNC